MKQRKNQDCALRCSKNLRSKPKISELAALKQRKFLTASHLFFGTHTDVALKATLQHLFNLIIFEASVSVLQSFGRFFASLRMNFFNV